MSEFLTKINELIVTIDDIVWGVPLIVLIMVVGIYLTCRLKLLQIFHLPRALKWMFADEEEGSGEVSSFGALCTALSATIGTGNIVGVATAIGILAGGPGALFWMMIAAFFGMATKYAEGFLAIKYRVIGDDGHVLGGPFYYIEKGMGKQWIWLAKLFAVFGAAAGLMGIGTFVQMNSVSSAVVGYFDPLNTNTVSLLGREYSVSAVAVGLVVTIFAAVVIFGGIRRISNATTVLVTFMAALYIGATLILIVCNIEKLPEAFVTIIESAFGLRAVSGGVLAAILVSMQKGIARGVFTHESGMGSAPIATAAARSNDAVRQGLVTMTGTFIDTMVICLLTGLCIIMMGSYEATKSVDGVTRILEGVEVTNHAFQTGLPFSSQVSSFILMICLSFFAVATILGWNYYGERCCEYLFNGNEKSVRIYRYLYIISVFIGPYMSLAAVWNIADIFNGLMALPNLVALLALSSITVKETNSYFDKYKKYRK